MLGISLLAAAARAQQLTQTITFQPGWNAVWLEVAPTNRSPAVVFAGLPLASVWTWSERVSATDFIQNPAKAGWNRNQWLGWFPTNSPEAALGNLYAIIPARAYLVKLAGTVQKTFQVTGTVVPPPTPGLRTSITSAGSRLIQRGLRPFENFSGTPPLFGTLAATPRLPFIG